MQSHGKSLSLLLCIYDTPVATLAKSDNGQADVASFVGSEVTFQDGRHRS